MKLIKKTLEDHPNLIVTKKVCPYCIVAKKLLEKHKISFHELKAEDNMELVREVRSEFSHMTVPIIFLNKKFIGGCDDLTELLENSGNKENDLI